jgi:hypothetical protein
VSRWDRKVADRPRAPNESLAFAGQTVALLFKLADALLVWGIRGEFPRMAFGDLR